MNSSGTLETRSPINYIPYTVSPNGTIAAYSIKTFASSDTNMRDANGQLYPDAKIYYNYYGQTDYTDAIMMAFFDGKKTSFDNGNFGFIGGDHGKFFYVL